MSTNTHRIQLDLAPNAMARLTNVKALTEAASYAETIRNALTIYEQLINDTSSGQRLFMQEKGGGALIPYTFRGLT